MLEKRRTETNRDPVFSLKLAMDIVNIIMKRGVPESHLQKIIRSGFLYDLLDGNIDQTDRDAFRKVLGLKAIGFEPLGKLNKTPF